VRVIVFVALLYETVAATAAPPFGASVTVDAVTVAGSSERDMVAVIVGCARRSLLRSRATSR
jgi:hypothetical protein